MDAPELPLMPADRLTHFHQLQDALDRGHEVQSYLARLQPHRGTVDPPLAEQLRAAYRAWYTATQRLLPADLRSRFIAAYAGDALKPRLQFYLDHYADEIADPPLTSNPSSYRWKYSYASHYQRYMHEQLDLVVEARKRSMESPSAVPEALKHLIAQPFASRKHSVQTINGIFEGAGAKRSWRVKMPQIGMIGGQKVRQVWCWLDGVRLHAPDQEYSIVAAVCHTLMAQNMVGAATGQQMERLLQQAQTPPSVPAGQSQAPAVPYAPIHERGRVPMTATTAPNAPVGMDADEREHYESLLRLHQQHLRHLERQVAGFGSLYVPPHLHQMVDEERSAIARLHALLAPDQAPAEPSSALPHHEGDAAAYAALLNRYAITIVRVIDPTTSLITCNYCEGRGRRPHTVRDWKVMAYYEVACGVCCGKGLVTVRVDDTLIPHARCEGSGKARPNAKTRDVKVCSGCRGLGVQSATGAIQVIE